MTDAALTAAEGVSEVVLTSDRIGIPRSLYLYVNDGIQALSVLARGLYLYVNDGIQALTVLARSLYEYENLGIQALIVLGRSLYAYEATDDSEVFPWLMRLDPTEQVRGGQVDLYGDGLGEIVDVAPAATITVSSSSGSNVAAYAVDHLANEWASTETVTDAWIRFTFGAAKKIVAVTLQGRTSGPAWGAPVFRFSDGGADVVGAALGLASTAYSTPEYPASADRVLYVLPAARTATWVEVRSTANGGGQANRGFREVQVLEDSDTAAETSTTLLGVDGMGIVTWSNRSVGLYPANGEVPILPAATVTVPPAGVSGLVTVKEIT